MITLRIVENSGEEYDGKEVLNKQGAYKNND